MTGTTPITDSVVRRSALVAAGHSNHTLATRCRPGGPWQQLLPGILLLGSGPPTQRQRLTAALLYAGPEALITGVAALRELGAFSEESDEVHLLVPINRRLSSREYVRVERTNRMPRPTIVNSLSLAPAHRAALDAARRERDPTRRRTLLFSPVTAGLCSVAQLRTELDAGAQRGTAALRTMLDNPVPAVTSTVHQGWAKRVLKRAPLPPPDWNIAVHTSTGRCLGVADAWWDEVALAWDFGNQRDQRGDERRTKFARAGLVFMQTDVADLRGNTDAVAEDLTIAFRRAAKTERPEIWTRPAEAVS